MTAYDRGFEDAKKIYRRYGSWSEKQVAYKDSFGDFHFGFKCSECGAIINKANFCGNCGAMMDVYTGDYYMPKEGCKNEK